MTRTLVIASNDYLSSVPGSGYVAHGGPANFALQLSKAVVSAGNTWIGLVQDVKEDHMLKSEVLHKTKSKSCIGVGISRSRVDKVLQISSRRRPDLVMAQEIQFVSKVLSEIKPDVLFLNGFSAYAWILSEAAYALNIPVIIQHAGVWAVEVRQYAEHFTPYGRRACYWMERRASELATCNVFLNETSMKKFSNILRAKPRGSMIIPLPDRGWESSVSHYGPKKRSERIIGVVSRWDRIKNHDAVLELMRCIKRHSLPWVVKSVTAIPNSAVRSDFKAAYQNEIEVIKPMGPEELKKFYRTLDVLILPSHFDVSPTVVMEALSQGVPSLISEGVGWASEYEKQGMEEWIVDFKHPFAVIKKLKQHFAVLSWKEVQRLAKNIKMCHNQKTIHETYIRLFKRIAS